MDTDLQIIAIGTMAAKIQANTKLNAKVYYLDIDADVINKSQHANQLQIGPKVSKSAEVKSNPHAGFATTLESRIEIEQVLNNASDDIIVGCLGDKNSMTTHMVCKWANTPTKSSEVILTIPFRFEGEKVKIFAKKALKKIFNEEPHAKLALFSQDNIIKDEVSLSDAYSRIKELEIGELRNAIGFKNLV